jgi:hypothetical protein
MFCVSKNLWKRQHIRYATNSVRNTLYNVEAELRTFELQPTPKSNNIDQTLWQ